MESTTGRMSCLSRVRTTLLTLSNGQEYFLDDSTVSILYLEILALDLPILPKYENIYPKKQYILALTRFFGK